MASLPVGPATYVARCAGIVSPAEHDRLIALLTGMCIRRNTFEENEYGLSAPLQSGTKRSTFKMIKQVQTAREMMPLAPAPPIIWRIVHESVPLKGKQYNDLPAAVLEVSESSLSGMYSVQFFCNLGAEMTYRVARRSQVFVCSHEGAEVQVTVFNVVSRHTELPLFEGHAVEARLPAAPEQQVETARKLGSFCQKLLPMVLLKKV